MRLPRLPGARIRYVAVFRHEIVLPSCSRDWLQQFIAELHDQVEALRFDGGHLAEQPPGSQEVLLVAGRHACMGAEYQVGPQASGTRLTITAWNRARETGVRALIRDQGAIITASAKLRSASRPEIIEIRGEYQDPQGPRLFRRASWRAKISLKGWWEYLDAGKGPAPAVAEVTHPLLKGKLEVYPHPAEGAPPRALGRGRRRQGTRPVMGAPVARRCPRGYPPHPPRRLPANARWHRAQRRCVLDRVPQREPGRGSQGCARVAVRATTRSAR